jgi:hypothetical protein
MFRRLHYVLVLALQLFVGPLHANTSIEISPFLVTGYTDGFKRGFESKLEFKLLEAGEITKGVMLVQQAEGKGRKLFGQDWISVASTARTVIKGEKLEIRTLDLYDTKTHLKVHSIDLRDESVTTYQWSSPLKSMLPGQRTKVGTVIEKDRAGKVVSNGVVEFLLTKRVGGFEFCTIETNKKSGTTEVEIVKDCDHFDDKKNITHYLIEIKTGTQSVMTGSGNIRIK